MNTRFAIALAIGVAALALTATSQAQHKPHTHRHPSAATLKNPVASSAASIDAGRTLYEPHCADCHGNSGKGDGHEGEGLAEKPSNFTDAEWEHGSTDGEIFVVIRDGAGPKSEMKGFAKQLTARQIWDVVNFVRTLAPKNSHE
jgi:mono/diheme cytochrome c family protein